MTSTENKRKELEHILSKENFVKIAAAIILLRNQSSFKGAIGLLGACHPYPSQYVPSFIFLA